MGLAQVPTPVAIAATNAGRLTRVLRDLELVVPGVSSTIQEVGNHCQSCAPLLITRTDGRLTVGGTKQV
jgi:hypothetical protein